MTRKSFEEIRNMTPEERRQYYDEVSKLGDGQTPPKVRKKRQKNLKRKKRQEVNKTIREQKYDKPFDWNPQFQPKVASEVQRRRNKRLRGIAPIPTTE